MQLYTYTARDQNGQLMKGKVEARDLSHAASVLRERSLVIIKLAPVGESNSLFGFMSSRIGSEDKVTFTQQLATIINAGLPLSDGLAILQSQSKPAMTKVVSEMMRDIQGGGSFAAALESQKGVFSDIYIAAVKAGEASGKLDEVLSRLAETEEKKREFASKTKGALIYPVIVVIVMILVAIAMMVLVIPKLLAIFQDFGTDLPMMTKVLITLSNFAQKTWWLLFVIVGGTWYMVRKWYHTKIGRQRIDRMLLTLPIYGKLRVQVALADITRTLSLLVSSGISILEALEIVTKSAGNVVFEDALSSASEGVEKGLPLATMLAREQIFPPLLSQMVAVGEETGQLSGILAKVAHYFETESEHAIRNLTTAIEPLIMVVLGVGVMFLVMAIIMPIYQLTGSF